MDILLGLYSLGANILLPSRSDIQYSRYQCSNFQVHGKGRAMVFHHYKLSPVVPIAPSMGSLRSFQRELHIIT